jgi:hypothetical protein
MNETQSHCEICFSDTAALRRIPQMTSTTKPISEEAKRVEQAIEENRKIFKEMDKEARSQTYDD